MKLAAIEKPLPLEPVTAEDVVLTYSWYDNFDTTKENKKGSIHTTHGIAFQEPSSGAKPIDKAHLTVERSGRKSLTSHIEELPTPVVDPHKPPST